VPRAEVQDTAGNTVRLRGLLVRQAEGMIYLNDMRIAKL
jgi:hypothetical protein